MFVTSIVYSWSLLSRMSALYWYYDNMVLRFVWYRLVFIQSIWKVYIYLTCINTQERATAPFDNNSVISYSNHQKRGLNQWSADRCLSDSAISDNILLQPISVSACPRPEHIPIQYYDCWYHLSQTWTCTHSVLRLLISFQEAPWYGFVFYVQAICITW